MWNLLAWVLVLIAAVGLLTWAYTLWMIRGRFLRIIAAGLTKVLQEYSDHTTAIEPDVVESFYKGQLEAAVRIVTSTYGFDGLTDLADLLPDSVREAWQKFLAERDSHSRWE